METSEFVTDTATLCVFDVSALHHRIDDDCDWWTVPDDELSEVNKGNIAFIGLGSDGKYKLHLASSLDGSEDCAILLNCPSGRVFLGAGEEVTGGGLEPEAVRGGLFTTVPPGGYRLAVRRKSNREILLALTPHEGEATNQLVNPIRI